MLPIEHILVEKFPAYLAESVESEWQAIEADYQPGMEIEGTIVARFSFGLVVDFGAPLPGLLLGTRIPGCNGSILEKDPKYSLGTRIAVKVDRFAKNLRQISLTHPDY